MLQYRKPKKISELNKALKKSLLSRWGETSSVYPSGGHEETFSSVLTATPCGRLQTAHCRTAQATPASAQAAWSSPAAPPQPCGSSPGCARCCTAGRRLGGTRFRVAVRVGHSSNTPAGPVCVELHGKASKSSVLLMGPSSSMIRERELAVASCPAPCLVGVQRHLLWLLVLLLEEKKDVLGSQ